MSYDHAAHREALEDFIAPFEDKRDLSMGMREELQDAIGACNDANLFTMYLDLDTAMGAWAMIEAVHANGFFPHVLNHEGFLKRGPDNFKASQA